MLDNVNQTYLLAIYQCKKSSAMTQNVLKIQAPFAQGVQLRVRQGGGEGQDAVGRLAVAGHLDAARSARLRSVASFWRNRHRRVQRQRSAHEGRRQHRR